MNMNDETKGDVLDVEVVEEAGIVQQHERAAMDMQVATAQALGRSIQAFQNDLETWCTATQEIAEECTYVLKKGGKDIIGPSIRFAELLQTSYRHVAAETFIEKEAHDHVVVGATARDLFRNVAVRVRVRRNILTRKKERFGPDMIQTTVQAAGSLALRNAIIRLVPKALWLDIWLKSRSVAQGFDPDSGQRIVPMAESVERAVAFLGNFAITEAEILAHLGYDSRAEITPDDLTLLRNRARSIKAGEIRPDEAFPADEPLQTGGQEQAADVADRIGKAAAKAPKKKAAAKKKAAKKEKPAEEEAPPPAEEEAPPADENLDELPAVDL